MLGERTRERLMQLAEAEQPGSRSSCSARRRSSPSTAEQSGDAGQDREDLLATAVAAYLVLLGAHGRGLAGYWRTVALLGETARTRDPGAVAD